MRTGCWAMANGLVSWLETRRNNTGRLNKGVMVKRNVGGSM